MNLVQQMKHALREAAKERGLDRPTPLSRFLGVAENEARRLLCPNHETRLSTIEKHMEKFGKKIELIVK